jgi:transcriptional regulator with XRE-family HTH domain
MASTPSIVLPLPAARRLAVAVASAVKRARAQDGLSVRNVADVLGVSPSTIVRAETPEGAERLPWGVVARLAIMLRLDLNSAIYGQKGKHRSRDGVRAAA